MGERHFFAKAQDLLPGFERLEQTIELQYVLTGNFDSNRLTCVQHGRELTNLGVAKSGGLVTEPAYLVMLRTSPVRPREIRLDHGGCRFAFDQLLNPDSVVLRCGGLYDESTLISGGVATMGKTSEAVMLQRRVSSALTKGFRRVGTFWLGPEALGLMHAGGRLTQQIGSPPEYDLQFPSKDGV